MLNFIVDVGLCSFCGECARDCISNIIEQAGGELPFIRPENEASCLRCQHCLAICPTGALSIHGRDPADSKRISEGGFPSYQQMALLVRGRRSVRRYRNENVSSDLIRDLFSTLAHVPTANNGQKLTFTFIDDKEVMRSFQERATASLTAIMGKKVSKDDWFLNNCAAVFLEKGPGSIFHDAPHLLIVSAPLEVFSAREDVILALAYFELLAQSAGLGTVWCGMLKSMLESVPDLKRWLQLSDRHFYYPMLFGPPAVRYPRTVQRDNSAVVRRIAPGLLPQ